MLVSHKGKKMANLNIMTGSLYQAMLISTGNAKTVQKKLETITVRKDRNTRLRACRIKLRQSDWKCGNNMRVYR